MAKNQPQNKPVALQGTFKATLTPEQTRTETLTGFPHKGIFQSFKAGFRDKVVCCLTWAYIRGGIQAKDMPKSEIEELCASDGLGTVLSTLKSQNIVTWKSQGRWELYDLKRYYDLYPNNTLEELFIKLQFDRLAVQSLLKQTQPVSEDEKSDTKNTFNTHLAEIERRLDTIIAELQDFQTGKNQLQAYLQTSISGLDVKKRQIEASLRQLKSDCQKLRS